MSDGTPGVNGGYCVTHFIGLMPRGGHKCVKCWNYYVGRYRSFVVMKTICPAVVPLAVLNE